MTAAPRRRLPNSPWLHEEIGRRMVQRLSWITLKPSSWVNWAPLAGGQACHEAVRAQYPDAACSLDGPDADAALANWVAGKSWNPFRRSAKLKRMAPGETVDMVWSNMALHAHAQADAAALLAHWAASLRIDGFLMFSCLGPDSLRELAVLHAQQGWPAPSAPFVDMHDWGDRLVGAGFAEPVMDMERIVLTYSGPDALIDELRGLGRNQQPERFAGLRSRAWGRHYRDVLAKELDRDEEGRLRLTFEVVYGHAFKPAPRIKAGAPSAIGLDDMRAMLRKPRPRS